MKGGGPKKAEETRDIITGLSDERGTSSAYLLRRLARAAPATLAAYEAGEFSSARAAAKAAGIPVADGLGAPATLARRIAARGPDYAREVIAALRAELGEAL